MCIACDIAAQRMKENLGRIDLDKISLEGIRELNHSNNYENKQYQGRSSRSVYAGSTEEYSSDSANRYNLQDIFRY